MNRLCRKPLNKQQGITGSRNCLSQDSAAKGAECSGHFQEQESEHLGERGVAVGVETRQSERNGSSNKEGPHLPQGLLVEG